MNRRGVVVFLWLVACVLAPPARAEGPARSPKPLRFTMARDRHGRPFAHVYLTDPLSGDLLLAKTQRGKLYAKWRVASPPGYVSTQYPIEIIVNSPRSLPVKVHVDFGPEGFPGFGLELNGKAAEFGHSGLYKGGYYTMWLPGGRNVICYGSF